MRKMASFADIVLLRVSKSLVRDETCFSVFVLLEPDLSYSACIQDVFVLAVRPCVHVPVLQVVLQRPFCSSGHFF